MQHGPAQLSPDMHAHLVCFLKAETLSCDSTCHGQGREPRNRQAASRLTRRDPHPLTRASTPAHPQHSQVALSGSTLQGPARVLLELASAAPVAGGRRRRRPGRARRDAARSAGAQAQQAAGRRASQRVQPAAVRQGLQYRGPCRAGRGAQHRARRHLSERAPCRGCMLGWSERGCCALLCLCAAQPSVAVLSASRVFRSQHPAKAAARDRMHASLGLKARSRELLRVPSALCNS
jgi:hypothetical protein